MSPGFQNLPVKASSVDGRNFTLIEPLVYMAEDGQLFRAPAGVDTDGASTPRILWREFPPFGTYWPAAILHDAAYRDTLEVFVSGAWIKASLNKDQCDTLLLEGMKILNVSVVARDCIYEGVHKGGAWSFNQDREKENLNLNT